MSEQATTLKKFQKDAVNSAVNVLEKCLDLISQSRGMPLEEQNRRTAISNYGNVLFEAPTGVGKTLMAGTTVESLSVKQNKVIWFWFAPFSGVVNQTIRTIQAEHKGLRPKEPKTGRFAGDLRSGDVFVTTWSSLAVSSKDSRVARQSDESRLSIDSLIEYAKASDFSIGVVIDEAHHSFRGQSQAYKFYRDIISPEVTILVTATPRDRDIEKFKLENKIENLNRISVSRKEGVEAKLLKRGVKIGVFKTQEGFENFVDMQLTALRYGIASHRRVKQQLSDSGISMTPLLLVQADSSANSIDRIQDWLKNEGFTSTQVRTHTSDEPDPHLMAIAADEKVEVLIFKMAVAMGFDAPRAQTLVSMRNTVDPDFGVQIVGRIMRVHKTIQRSENVPLPLQYGYVFISNREGQRGLSEAATRINGIRTELADVTDNVTVVEIGGQGLSVQTTKNGQATFFPSSDDVNIQSEDDLQDATNTSYVTPQQPDLLGDSIDQTLGHMGMLGGGFKPTHNPVDKNGKTTDYSGPEFNEYYLRSNADIPSSFFKAVTKADDESKIIADVISYLDLPSIYHLSLRENVNINVTTTEIFEGIVEDPERFQVQLSDRNLAKTAQYSLNLADRDGYIDPRKLKRALEEQLQLIYKKNDVANNDDRMVVRKGVNRLLALYPERFKRAVKEAVNRNTVAVEADPLPEKIKIDFALVPSRLNIYGVYPSDLNKWEKKFAERLDDDATGTVKWWHRNPVHKPSSVFIPVPGFNNYYPDFIVGVYDRQIGDGIILVETKNFYNDDLSIAKTQVVHPIYDRPMMLYRKDKRDWYTVEYDREKTKNILDKIFETELLSTYPN